MDINNVLTYLKEELRDIPAKPDNVHYTNLERLYYILQTGLEGQRSYRTKTHRTKDDDMELATVRGNHNLTNTEKRSLSSNVERGGVKINLFTDRILASVRGAKKAPIAEFPLQRGIDQRKDEEYFRRAFGFEIPRLFDSRKVYFTNDSDGFIDKEVVTDWLRKNEPAKLEEFKTRIVNEIYCYNRSLFNLKQEVEAREREERFILKKNIPIDPNLMEIVIDKKPEDYSMYDDEFIEEMAPNYLKLVNRHEDVFLHNKEFRLFKNYLRKKIDDDFSKRT